MQYSDPSLVDFPWETRDRTGHSYLSCEVALYLLSSCYRLMSAVWLCVSVCERVRVWWIWDAVTFPLRDWPCVVQRPQGIFTIFTQISPNMSAVLLGPVTLEKNDSWPSPTRWRGGWHAWISEISLDFCLHCTRNRNHSCILFDSATLKYLWRH